MYVWIRALSESLYERFVCCRQRASLQLSSSSELEPSNKKNVCILLPVSRTRHRTTGAMHPSRRIDEDDVTGQEFRLYRSDARGENPVRTLPTRSQCACEGVVDDNDGYYDNEERAQSVSGGRTARDVRGTRVEQRGSEA